MYRNLLHIITLTVPCMNSKYSGKQKCARVGAGLNGWWKSVHSLCHFVTQPVEADAPPPHPGPVSARDFFS